MEVHVLVFTYGEKYESGRTQCIIEGVFSSRNLAENYKQKLIEDDIRRRMSENPGFDYDNTRKIRNQELKVIDFDVKEEQESQPQQDDVTQKLQKIVELHQKGMLTNEEFQSLKSRLIAKL